LRYNLGDLRSVTDEMLGGLTVDEQKAAVISSFCRANSRLRARAEAKRWPLFAAASFVTCAAAVIFIFTAIANRPPVQADLADSGGNTVQQQVEATASADMPVTALATALPSTMGLVGASSDLSASALVSSQAPTSTEEPEYNYALVQGENGLYGLKTPNGKWVIEPKYTTAYVQDGIAYFTVGDTTLKYDITKY